MDTKIEANDKNKSIPYMIVHALVKIFEMNDINLDLHQMSKVIKVEEKEVEYKDSLESDHEEEQKESALEFQDNDDYDYIAELIEHQSHLSKYVKTEGSKIILSNSFTAGICLRDILSNKEWLLNIFEKDLSAEFNLKITS